jgi:hypothetical protein
MLVFLEPMLVDVRSRAWVCDLTLPGSVGSNPAWGMDVFLL